MKINFTKKQYISLLKIVYLGNWLINAIRTGQAGGKRIKEYDDLEQYIFSLSKELDLEEYIEYDKEFKKFFPTRKFEESPDIEKYRQEYDDENFWDELNYRLAERDFINAYEEKNVQQMDIFERIGKEQPFLDKYAQELEENGINNLVILDKKKN